MLSMAIKLDASRRLDDIIVEAVPNMGQEQADNIIEHYQRISSDNSLVDLDYDKEGIEKLKKVFNR